MERVRQGWEQVERKTREMTVFFKSASDDRRTSEKGGGRAPLDKGEEEPFSSAIGVCWGREKRDERTIWRG